MKWSNRLWDKFIDEYYSVNGFPLWVQVANKRYRPIYLRWYGL